MSLDVQIRVDTTQALPAAKSVESALAGVEGRGTQAGAGIARGMREGSSAMDRAKQQAGGLGSAMKELSGLAKGFGAALAVKQVIDFSDSYTSLENKIRQVTSSQGELAAVMARTKEIANNTRSDWGTTGAAFVKLVQATKQLGMSQERAFNVTETLSMAMQSSGASATEAASGTLQLMQALRAGTLQGDEFRSISENMPVLLDVLSKQLGVTTGELKKMGAEGKLTTDVIIAGLESSASTIRDNFGKTVPTVSQQWTVFKNEVTSGIGSFMEQTQIITKLGDVMKTLGSAIKPLASILGEIYEAGQTLNGWMESAQGALGELGTAIGYVTKPFTLMKDLLGSLGGESDLMAAVRKGQDDLKIAWLNNTEAGWQFNAMLQDQIKRMADLTALAMMYAKGTTAGGAADPWGDSRNSLAVYRDGLLGTLGLLEEFGKKKKDAFDKASDSEKTYAWEDEQGLSSSQANENNFNQQQSFDRSDAYAGMTDISAGLSSATLEALAFQKELDGIALAAKKYELDMASANDGVARGFNKIADEIQNTAQLTENLLVNAFHSFEDAMVQAALTGELSFSRMIESMLADLTRLAMRQAMVGLLGSLLPAPAGPAGPLGPLSADLLPRYATGGQFMVGGQGGTDTTPVQFMATPGERVTVETPAQQAGGSSGGSAPATVIVQNNYDPRAILKALHSREGATVIANVLRDNPGLMKG